MQDFVHLHVHTQYSILDGQASIPRLVDKAIANGMRGIAVTDHGDMFGIKEFFNYVNKKNGGTNGEIKDLKKKLLPSKAVRKNRKTPKRRLRLARNSWRQRKRNCSNRFSAVRCTWRAVGWKIRKESPTRADITWWCWPRT